MPSALLICCMQRQDVHIGTDTLKEGQPGKHPKSCKAHHTLRKQERSPVRDVDSRVDMRDSPLNQIVQYKLPGGHTDLSAARLGDPPANPALHHEALVIPCEVMEPARRRDGLIEVAQR